MSGAASEPGLTNQNLNSLSMWRVCNLHHTSVFTYSHANTPLGQSERVYYLSYFIRADSQRGTAELTTVHRKQGRVV